MRFPKVSDKAEISGELRRRRRWGSGAAMLGKKRRQGDEDGSETPGKMGKFSSRHNDLRRRREVKESLPGCVDSGSSGGARVEEVRVWGLGWERKKRKSLSMYKNLKTSVTLSEIRKTVPLYNFLLKISLHSLIKIRFIFVTD